MATAHIGGIDIGYQDVGRGLPVVLLHGHPFNRSMWREQVEALRGEYRIITPDLPGYGESTPVPAWIGMDEMARYIADLIAMLDLAPVVLVGLSMAGQIALEFAHLFPTRLRALILADTAAHAETAEGRRSRHAVADRVLSEGMRWIAVESLPKLLAPASLRDHPELGDRVMTMMLGTSPVGAAAALRGRAERRDHIPFLPQIGVPTLVIVGSLDEYTPVADAALLHHQIPGSQLAVIEGAGHLPNLEDPEAFNAVVRAFLDNIREAW